MGTVILSGRFYGDEKMGIADAMQWQLEHVTEMWMNFYSSSGGSYSLSVDVVDGEYDASIQLRAGIYEVYTGLFDQFGNETFADWQQEVEVVSGEESVVDILVETRLGYYFRFHMSGLPGEYKSWGNGTVTTSTQQQFYVYYYEEWDYDLEKYRQTFYAWLPITFDGDELEASMELDDVNGDRYHAMLDFDLSDTEIGMMELEYVHPPWIVDVTINVGVDKHYIYANGGYWESVQQAINYQSSPVVIDLGEGVYEGFTETWGIWDISIRGLGEDKTTLINTWGDNLPPGVVLIDLTVVEEMPPTEE
jgi:hypothetical protein